MKKHLIIALLFQLLISCSADQEIIKNDSVLTPKATLPKLSLYVDHGVSYANKLAMISEIDYTKISGKKNIDIVMFSMENSIPDLKKVKVLYASHKKEKGVWKLTAPVKINNSYDFYTVATRSDLGGKNVLTNYNPKVKYFINFYTQINYKGNLTQYELIPGQSQSRFNFQKNKFRSYKVVLAKKYP